MYKKNYFALLMSLFVGVDLAASSNQESVSLQSREVEEEVATTADQPVVSNNSGNQTVAMIPALPVMPAAQPVRDTGAGAIRSYNTASIFMSRGPVQNS